MSTNSCAAIIESNSQNLVLVRVMIVVKEDNSFSAKVRVYHTCISNIFLKFQIKIIIALSELL